MYHLKKYYNLMKNTKEVVINYRSLLLQRLFLKRAMDGKNDIAFFQSLYKFCYITREDLIKNNEKNFRFVSEDVSPVYSNIISTVVNKAEDNKDTRDHVLNYLVSEVFKKGADNHFGNLLTSKLWNRYVNTKLPDDKAMLMSYIALKAYEDDYEQTQLALGVCSKYKLFPKSFTLSQCTLLETISDMLGEDVVNKENFINRLISRRTNELFAYLIKLMPQYNETDFSDYTESDKYQFICKAACGQSEINHKNNHDKSAFIESFNSAKKRELSPKTELALGEVFPLGKIGVNSFTDTLSKYNGNELSRFSFIEKSIGAFIDKEESVIAFKQAILEQLLEVLTINRCIDSENKTPIKLDQVMRQLSYSDEDCRVVFEKIGSSIKELFLAFRYKTVVDKAIINADYTNMKYYVWGNSLQDRLNEETNKSINRVTKKTVDAVENKFEEAKAKIEKLERENQQLREALIEQKNQINRDDNANQIINELKEKIEILTDESDSFKSRIQRLTTERKTVDGQTINKQTEQPIDDSFFQDKKIIIVGGRWEINRKLEEIMPKLKIVNKETEAMLNVKHYDLVIFFTDFLNHSKYIKYIQKCRIHNIPVIYLQGSNLDNIKKEIFLFYEEQDMLSEASFEEKSI